MKGLVADRRLLIQYLMSNTKGLNDCIFFDSKEARLKRGVPKEIQDGY